MLFGKLDFADNLKQKKTLGVNGYCLQSRRVFAIISQCEYEQTVITKE